MLLKAHGRNSVLICLRDGFGHPDAFEALDRCSFLPELAHLYVPRYLDVLIMSGMCTPLHALGIQAVVNLFDEGGQLASPKMA
jgi:hypothetical protein